MRLNTIRKNRLPIDFTRSYESRFVNVTGDTMTGALTITPSADSTSVFKVTNAANTVNVFTLDTTNKRLGVNGAPGYAMDVWGNAYQIGADWPPHKITRTDATIKESDMVMPHYTNSEEPVMIFAGNSQSGSNGVDFGGSSSVFNAVSNIGFWTAANSTTTAGTLRFQIRSSYTVIFGANTLAAPITHTLRSPNATGTDIGGSNMIIAAGQSTGTGTGGYIYFQTSSAAGSSSSNLNSLTTQLSVLGNGNIGIGTVSPGAKMDIFNNTAALLNVAIRQEISGYQSTLQFKRATTGPAIVTTSNQLGNIDFMGYDGANYIVGARIQSNVDGLTPGTNDMPGNLVFYTTPDGSATPVEAMRINSAGNVGIGTTTPDGKLDLRDGKFYLSDADVDHGMTGHVPTNVYGALSPVSLTAGGLDIHSFTDADGVALDIIAITGATNPTDTTPVIQLTAGKKNTTSGQAIGAWETAFNFRNWTTNLVTILGSGNVGIGTTAPVAALDVVGSTFSGSNLRISSNLTDATLKSAKVGIEHYTNAEEDMFLIGGDAGVTSNSIYIGGSTSTHNAATAIILYTAANNTTVTGTERMKITATGLVGINCTPAQTLDVKGTTDANSATIARFYTNTSTIGSFLIKNLTSSDPGMLLATGGSGETLALGTNGTEYMRIASTGNVGIGDTAPAEILDVTGNTNVTGVYKVDDVQVVGNRVIDARIDDTPNSGDATTDGIIAAIQSILQTHGLAAAS